LESSTRDLKSTINVRLNKFKEYLIKPKETPYQADFNYVKKIETKYKNKNDVIEIKNLKSLKEDHN